MSERYTGADSGIQTPEGGTTRINIYSGNEVTISGNAKLGIPEIKFGVRAHCGGNSAVTVEINNGDLRATARTRVRVRKNNLQIRVGGFARCSIVENCGWCSVGAEEDAQALEENVVAAGSVVEVGSNNLRGIVGCRRGHILVIRRENKGLINLKGGAFFLLGKGNVGHLTFWGEDFTSTIVTPSPEKVGTLWRRVDPLLYKLYKVDLSTVAGQVYYLPLNENDLGTCGSRYAITVQGRPLFFVEARNQNGSGLYILFEISKGKNGNLATPIAVLTTLPVKEMPSSVTNALGTVIPAEAVRLLRERCIC
uniref:Uncharacterized protein n=1 Tax=candidate division CPR3 bacterium TaxID=2268181 RepID=A0A7C5UVX4_UNCC3